MARMVRIPISSGVINGTYVCFEVIVSVLLVRFINIILGCWNVKRIYDDRKVLYLSRTRYEAISGGAHSSKKASVTAIVVLIIGVLLAGIGGFSFVGVTEPKYKLVRVRNLVKKAAPGRELDLRKHIRYREKLMSGAVFLLLQFWGCQRRSQEVFELLEYSNNLDDITTPVHEFDYLPVPNQTCLSFRSGYDERISVERDESKFRLHNSSELVGCYARVQWLALQRWNWTKVDFGIEGECHYSVREGWCFRNHHPDYSEDFASCAVSLKSGDEFAFEFLFFHSNATEYPITSPIPVENELSTRNLIAMTIFRLIWQREATEIYLMSLLTVEMDAYVPKLDGSRSVTEVNIVLLAATLGPALALLMIVGVVALIAWFRVLVLPGRLQYNRLCSAKEILSFAASKAAVTDRSSQLREKDEVLVGISSLVPHVGPLGPGENRGNSKFLEDELVGRRRQGRIFRE